MPANPPPPVLLTVNGQPTPCPQPATLQALVNALAPGNGTIVAEHNGTIIPQEKWATCTLADGDTIELIHFVGGG